MRYLGVDLGLKKIGFAISEGELASPLKVVSINNFEEAISKIINIVEDETSDLIIIGSPEGEMGKVVKKVLQRLKSEGFETVLTDETLSTRKSKDLMLEMGLSRKKRHEDDSIAAAIILQRFLDEKK